jgi:ArsR family transcriptional regulator
MPHDRAEYREQMGHQWLGFGASELGGWLGEAGFEASRLIALPVDASAKGPPLFAMTARADRSH